MSGNQQTRRRVSYNQLEALFEFLNAHREVAVGYNKSAQARQHSKEMWARAADLLSSAVLGGSEGKGKEIWSNIAHHINNLCP